MNFYAKRGVSAQKEEVHAAVKKLSQGLFPHSFCKIFPDFLGEDEQWVNVMHADGAGSKTILAYLYWKETGDLSIWKNIAQDAVVMNLDDLLCVGIYDKLVFNSTIDRNKRLIPGDVLTAIIDGTQDFFNEMGKFGIHIHYLGGETADVGDVVRTIAVNGTITSRWPLSKIISNERIKEGDVIVGLAGFGQTTYEKEYNSGIGSNGLTSARHDVLSKWYAKQFKESYDPDLDDSVTYIGKYKLTDIDPLSGNLIGKLLLSPTRTFAPLLKELFLSHFDKIHGMVHCSGGGQTKCMKYMPSSFSIVKNNLFIPPSVFTIIEQSSGSSLREMYEVFNMGCRMEIFCDANDANIFIKAAADFNIEAQITGFVGKKGKKEVIIETENETLVYNQ